MSNHDEKAAPRGATLRPPAAMTEEGDRSGAIGSGGYSLEIRKADDSSVGCTASDRTDNDWRIIESAPKDGHSVVLWGCLENSPRSRPHIGSEDIHLAIFDRIAHAWLSLEVECGWIISPTHWHPFPQTGPTTQPRETV